MAGISIFYSIIMLKWLSFKEEYIIMKILKFYKQIGKGYFNMDTMSLTAKYEDEMIAIRRHIHRHPELSNKEYKTTEFIREKLTEYGVEIAEIGMKTGVVAVIRGGKPGKTVAIREDIDALPMKELTGLPFASENDGACHSCGHDIHTTVLLYCAKVLSEIREELAGTVMLILYASGILLAVLMARLFKRFLFKDEDVPFVMELPPYRMPTGKSIMIHMWEKAKQYLHKMGGVILIASIIIWFLGYFPRHSENGDVFEKQIAEVEQSDTNPEDKVETIAELERLKSMDHQQKSYIGRIGQAIQPILHPLGFDWKMSVSLLTGMAAKEVVVSTLSVLYTGESDDSQVLTERLKQDKNAEGELVFTPLVALSFMLFVLIYFPCIATISAIVHESGSWKWGIFVIVYTCVLAWFVSCVVYQTGHFFMNLFN